MTTALLDVCIILLNAFVSRFGAMTNALRHAAHIRQSVLSNANKGELFSESSTMRHRYIFFWFYIQVSIPQKDLVLHKNQQILDEFYHFF